MILDKIVRKVLPKIVKNIQALILVEGAVLSLQEVAKKRRLRSLNIVDRDPWRNLKGLVRRQAANTLNLQTRWSGSRSVWRRKRESPHNSRGSSTVANR